jgi:cytochrome c5
MRWRAGKAIRDILVLSALALLSAGILWAASPPQATNGAPSRTAKSAKNPVHEITLPQYPPEMPPGPNLEIFQRHCLLCHSARYVTMQPHFSRVVWEKEVKKMVDAYGAPINPQDQQQIVEYLVIIQGPAEGK